MKDPLQLFSLNTFIDEFLPRFTGDFKATLEFPFKLRKLEIES